MMNNTSRSVAESDTCDLGVNTGRGLGAGADTTNVPDVTKVCSSAVSARASRQARMLRRSTKLKQPIPLANKQLMKKRGRGRPCIISANAFLDNNHRPWLSPTYLSKLDTLQTIPKEQYIDSGPDMVVEHVRLSWSDSDKVVGLVFRDQLFYVRTDWTYVLTGTETEPIMY
ncbi:hypothetical protein F2Q68_00013743 [Brassica cretica]|uniref:Uncharacterized protein n=1 Tax=Brassica cretica TaxID=69181 RepID=A0A8S9H9K0_BRACR|nr:hypothetical protein F2Q68_00013743 [Brassica cretica]